MKLLTIALFAFAASGCAVLEPFQDSAAEKVADGVNEYCDQTDAAFRADFRAQVNEQTENSIQVECAE